MPGKQNNQRKDGYSNMIAEEISTYEANGFHCPACKAPYSLTDQQVILVEGEVCAWTFGCMACGDRVKLFND